MNLSSMSPSSCMTLHDLRRDLRWILRWHSTSFRLFSALQLSLWRVVPCLRAWFIARQPSRIHLLVFNKLFFFRTSKIVPFGNQTLIRIGGIWQFAVDHNGKVYNLNIGTFSIWFDALPTNCIKILFGITEGRGVWVFGWWCGTKISFYWWGFLLSPSAWLSDFVISS